MNITTKFSLFDKIHFMHENKAECDNVAHIYVRVDDTESRHGPKVSIAYLTKKTTLKEIGESECFATKEELLKSL